MGESTPAPTVTLVGRLIEHNENLGLAYLRAALRRAGVSVETHYVNDGAEVARAAQAILARPPRVLGLSLADGGSAVWPLTLGELLHRRGFRGHVTCGGQFATLSRAWLLERHPWLGSVVRFAGERPLVELTARVRAGEPVAGVPGVTTREGDGAPAPVMDDTPMRLRPDHDELPRLLGHPTAHMTASRGCKGRCSYCGPAALQVLETREGKRAGHGSRALKLCGVGGVRRRHMEGVAEEMARLYHDESVRYFYFVDEHLLPYDEAEARELLADWREQLDERGVGRVGIGCMLRADRLTPAMLRDFADLGLVRCFVGLELATDEEGRRFGRRAPGRPELAVVRQLHDLGVATVSNLMLVHPDSTAESIASGIDLMRRLPAGVCEATRMMVYHGTLLHDRMRREGRLLGNPLRYGYTFEDPAMERFAEIFTRLRAEAFWNYSIAYRTHDTHLAAALARRLHPRRVTRDLGRRLDDACRDVVHLYADAYRAALDLALDGGGFADADALVAETRARGAAVERELAHLEGALRIDRRSTLLTPMRAAAASVLTFAVLTPAAACGKSHGSDAGVDASPSVDAGPRVDAGPADCTPAAETAAQAELRRRIAEEDACFSGFVRVTEGEPPSVSLDATGFAPSGVTVSPCFDDEATQRRLQESRDRVQALVDADLPACLPDGFHAIEGDSKEQMQALAEAIDPCGLDFSSRYRIVLDDAGAVVAVRAEPGGPDDISTCIEGVLDGLRFPCLSSFEVCPEFVIAE